MAYRSGDLNTSAVVSACGPIHKAGDGGKLAPDLLHHGKGSLAHALHGHCTEPVGQHSSDQQPSKHLQQTSDERPEGNDEQS